VPTLRFPRIIMTDPLLLKLENVHKTYNAPGGGPPQRVLEAIDLEVAAGQSVAVTGPSGCGKTTLLNLIGGLDRPSEGKISLNGRNLAELSDTELAHLRSRQIGFVFQFHHLLPQCTVLENVLIPTLVNASSKPTQARQRAERLLESVGLGGHQDHRPGELSGGQRQRVAVVRALINQPQLLLADEPTGSLDRAAAEQIGDLLVQVNRDHGLALIVVTHAPTLAERMQHCYTLQDGRINTTSQ